MEIVPGPLGGPVWVPERPPFWSQKWNIIFERAAKRDFGASQDGTEGVKEGVQKWVPKKVGQKSGESPKQASRPPYTERIRGHGKELKDG